MSEPRPTDAEHRWAAWPAAATLIRAVAVLVPIASGVAAGVGIARLVPRPGGMAVLPWLLAVLGASSIVVALVDRLARRLLPLATLLKLSLAFPDRVPSRFKLAREAGSPRVLQRRVQEARERGLDPEPARAAEAILTLVAALSAHDRKTRGHSERVRTFTDVLAEEFDLSPNDRDRLRWAALLHDVGKLEVPSETLNKPGKPNEEEWELLRRHPLEGERIAAPLLPWLGSWASVIGQHHERWDGRGYPRGMSGEEIGLGSRIVSVADSFEVMTAARSYKQPMTPKAARRELQRCAGQQFDPQVVRAFLNISLGRLRWIVGPASWAAQIPILLGIGRAGGQALTLSRAAGELAIRGLVGVAAVGVGVGAAPAAQAPQVRSSAAHGAVTMADAGPAPVVAEVTSHEAGDDTPGDDATTPGEDPSPDDRDEREGPGDEASGTSEEPAPNEVPEGGGHGGEDPSENRDDEGDSGGGGAGGGATVGDTVEEVVGGVGDTVEEVVGGVTETVDEVVGGVTETVDEVVGGVTETVDEVVGGVTETVEEVLGGLLGRR